MKFIMEEKIIRPTTKPEAIKGKLLKYQGTDYCEFMPQAQGEPQYEGISKTRNSQLKRSKGKAPKLVAHLTAQAESIDPYADMMEELGKLFPDNKKGMPKPHGRRLLAGSIFGLNYYVNILSILYGKKNADTSWPPFLGAGAATMM